MSARRLLLHLATAIALCTPPSLSASPEVDTTWSIGIYGGPQFISNTSSIPIVPGSTDCGEWGNGTSFGWSVGLGAVYPMSYAEGWLDVAPRLWLSSHPAVLTAQTSAYEVFDPSSGQYAPLVIEHTFDASMTSLGLDLGLLVHHPQVRWLSFRPAFHVSMPVLAAERTESDRILNPSSALWPSETKTRVTASGEFGRTATAYSVSAAVSAAIPLRDYLDIRLEAGWRQGLNSMLADAQWKQSAAFAGIGIEWRIPLDEQPTPPPPPTVPGEEDMPPPVVQPSVWTAMAGARPLQLQRTVVTETYPLLPYLFFDSLQAALPARYKSYAEVEDFAEQELPKETMSIYYSILDVVGARMKADPSSTLVLTGTGDGTEGGTVSERLELARARATSVASYLSRRWNIGADRLAVRSVEKPDLASSKEYAEGFAENRRVELSSPSRTLLRPVEHIRFLEYATIDSFARMSFAVTDQERDNPTVSWRVDVSRGGALVSSASGVGRPASVLTVPVDSAALAALGTSVASRDSLESVITLRKADGSQERLVCSVPLVVSDNDFEVGRLSLIVFDFDRADISAANAEMMRRFVRSSIHTNSTVSVTGSTDRLGEMKYNQELSERRARSVADIIARELPAARFANVVGMGATRLLYDNSIPEGRYYCRTVTVEVQTPVR